MILCLDTASVIDLIRGRPDVMRDRYRMAVQGGNDIVISVLTLHELISGVVTSRDPAVERARMDETIIGLPIIDLDAQDVERTGRVAGGLRHQGRPIGDIDTLIAGQALARGWTLVTRNVRHFGRVEGLPLIDWSVGAAPLSAKAIERRVAEGLA